MNTIIEENALVMIPLDRIVSTLSIRRLSPSGIERIKESMKRSGFLDSYPLVVVSLGVGTYQRIDGAHRYEAARELGISPVPCLVKTEMPENERYKLALQCNNAAETLVPSTLVTHAEFVWGRSEEGKTQNEIAEMLEWSREKVKNYASLKQIGSDAWEIIGTTFESAVPNSGEDVVPTNGTTVPVFTEGLLRSILDLEARQQLELVKALAHSDEKERITKGKFKTRAENYKARNEMKVYSLARVGELGESYTSQLIETINSRIHFDRSRRKNPDKEIVEWWKGMKRQQQMFAELDIDDLDFSA